MGHPTIFGLCAHIDQVYFFMCDFIDIIKVYQAKLYQFYTNPYTKFNDSTFDELNDFEMFVDKNLPTSWCAYLNGEEVDYFMIEFVGSKYCINPCYHVINEMRLMLRLGFQVVLVHVKKSYHDYSKSFIQKLHGKFLNYELMFALVVIYLNLWLTTPIMLRIFSSIISLYH